MSITETDRRQLHQAMHDLIGETADIFMAALPTEPDQVATKSDLRLLGSDLRTEMAELRTEMAELRTELRTEMAELRTELRSEMAELRTEMAELASSLRAEFHEATTGQTRTLLLGLFGTVVSMSLVQLVSLIVLA